MTQSNAAIQANPAETGETTLSGVSPPHHKISARAELRDRSHWETSLHQDGSIQDGYAVAELTALNTREGWPDGMRLIVRRVRPSRRQTKNLTAFETRTGWRYSITATNIRHMWGIAGSQHAQWLDVLHRSHAVVEDRVRCDKARGLHNLPSQSWSVNRGWMLAANLASDLEAWTRLLGLHDADGLADAEPDTLRYKLWHLPARLIRHARRRVLKIPGTWPGGPRSPPAGNGSPLCPHPPELPHPSGEQGRSENHLPEPWNPGAAAATREDPTSHPRAQTGRTDHPMRQRSPLTNRGQDRPQSVVDAEVGAHGLPQCPHRGPDFPMELPLQVRQFLRVPRGFRPIPLEVAVRVV